MRIKTKTVRVRESAIEVEVDNEEGWDPLLHLGVEPGSVLCLAFCSDAAGIQILMF